MPSAAALKLKCEDAPRSVRFDINALDEVERYLTAEVRDLVKDGSLMLKVRATRALLWGGLRHADPALTPHAVGDLMQRHLDAGGTLQEVYAAIFEALVNAGVVRMPEDGEGAAPPNAGAPPPAAA